MAEVIQDYVLLRRQILTPDVNVMRGLQAELTSKIGAHMPLDRQHVRVIRPEELAFNVLGNRAIRRVADAARRHPDQHLRTMTPAEIANHMYAALPGTKHGTCTIPSLSSDLVGMNERPTFTIKLGHSTAWKEGYRGALALRSLGRLPVSEYRPPKEQSLSLLLFRVPCPPKLENELKQITDGWISQNPEFTFKKVTPHDTANSPDPFMNLSAK